MIDPSHPAPAPKDLEYEKTIDYLYGLQYIGIKLGLDNITSLLDLLGRPQARFKSVHIAGSNAKGSTAAFIASILQAAGYRVGLYTSPHLIDFTERIKVNAEPVSPQEVIRLTRLIRGLIDNNPCFCAHPTFFEFTTAMAMCYFADAGVDIAVVETGMGGRLDATNVLYPLLSIITGISLEHQQYLGHNLAEIAHEKAGIIKPGGLVLSGVEETEARNVIEEECKNKQAELCSLCPNFNWHSKDSSLEGQRFELNTPQTRYTDLQIGLLGDFQLRNAALAVAAVELLGKQGLTINESAVRDGLAGTKWPGRMQLVSQKPYILLDGAHNPRASRAVALNLPNLLEYDRLILILGILKDKDVAGIIGEWINSADVFILTKPDSERAADPEDLARLIPSHKQVVLKDSIKQAISHAKDLADDATLICITGSLYTVGEALAQLQGYKGRRSSNQ